jgi:hypothetical protein
MTTYQALLNKIKSFATAHQQIKRFGSDFTEQFDNFVNEGDSFPVLYVSSVDSLSQLNQITYTLEITCADLILEDRANVNVILNDCKLILNDLFIYYNSGNDNSVHIEVEPTLTPLNNYSVDNLAGARMTVTFEVDTYGLCAIPIGEIEPTPSPDCEDANYTVRYVSGTVIESGVIASGGSKTIQVPDCPAPEPCDPVTYNITRDGEPFASGSEPSGGSININVPSDCPAPEPCADATVNVNGTLFDTVESGDTLDIEVRKSTGNDLIGSKQGQYWRVGDSEVNVNSVKLADVKATETLNITVVDSLDAAVSVTLSGGNKITIPSLPCVAPSCVDSYNLVDFFTLDRNNPFGNTNRFTAPDGTQTYTDGIVLDWFTGRDYAETVRMYGVSLIAAANLATQLSNEPYTIGAYSNFMLIEVEQLFELTRQRASAVTDALNYSPFNHVNNAVSTRVRTKTDFYNSTTNNWIYSDTGVITTQVKTQANQTIITRMANYTELGI